MAKLKSKKELIKYGSDIIKSNDMQKELEFIQHGNTTVYAHSISVALLCISISHNFNINIDKRALIRGALLHDYFLYDWHISDESHKMHGFTHAKTALYNANRDFNIGKIEQDMIKHHMFPLNLEPPKYKESIILCIADKICALKETFNGIFAF